MKFFLTLVRLCFSIVDLQTCSPDELLPAVLDQIPVDEVDNANSDYRQFERIHSLFSVSLEQPVRGVCG